MVLLPCLWSHGGDPHDRYMRIHGGRFVGVGNEWWVSVCVFGFVCGCAHIIWFAISFFCSSRTLSFLISFSMRLCDLSFSYESYAVSSRLAGSGDDQQAGRQAGRRDHTYRQARQIRVVSCGADHRQAHAHVASSSVVLARRQKAEDTRSSRDWTGWT